MVFGRTTCDAKVCASIFMSMCATVCPFHCLSKSHKRIICRMLQLCYRTRLRVLLLLLSEIRACTCVCVFTACVSVQVRNRKRERFSVKDRYGGSHIRVSEQALACTSIMDIFVCASMLPALVSFMCVYVCVSALDSVYERD